jgi:hypothetical protein
MTIQLVMLSGLEIGLTGLKKNRISKKGEGRLKKSERRVHVREREKKDKDSTDNCNLKLSTCF